MELIEPSKLAADELIDVLGRAQIEAVLRLSAEGVVGPLHPGRKGGAIGWQTHAISGQPAPALFSGGIHARVM